MARPEGRGGAVPPSGSDPARECAEMARCLRRWVIERSLAAGVGHVGSALSIVDLVAAMWATMRGAGTDDPARDRFILAKGHAALALYGALRFKGLLGQEQFETYCGEGSLLGAHPEHELPGVDLSTGSLGQGLSVGCGLAWGHRAGLPAGRRAIAPRVFVLMSDAECDEGQVWEAAMFAGHHRLGGLCAVVDANGTQALGLKNEVVTVPSLAAAWRAFGWEALEVDGHDHAALLNALAAPAAAAGEAAAGQDAPPRVIIARTIMGRGVSFMAGRVDWHYRNLTPELAEAALRELEALP